MGGKSVPKNPPPPAPPAEPQPLDESREAGEVMRRRYKNRSGQESTILAGRLMSERGKTLLGQ